MEVILNVPDEMFQELIENCENKAGQEFPSLKTAIKSVKKYNLKEQPVNEHDKKLYMWIAALVWDDILITTANGNSIK